jgi:hypothetical protein
MKKNKYNYLNKLQIFFFILSTDLKFVLNASGS